MLKVICCAYLPSNFPVSARHKLQPFTRAVQQTLERMNSKNARLSLVTDDDDEELMSARKKAKRVDGSEERLQRLENQHIRRRKQKGIDEEEEDESEETEGAVSTSEDAIYGERIEPEFDLMKSMLRANYSDSKVAMKLKKKAGKDGGEEC